MSVRPSSSARRSFDIGFSRHPCALLLSLVIGRKGRGVALLGLDQLLGQGVRRTGREHRLELLDAAGAGLAVIERDRAMLPVVLRGLGERGDNRLALGWQRLVGSDLLVDEVGRVARDPLGLGFRQLVTQALYFVGVGTCGDFRQRLTHNTECRRR
jgi:hypothetical protein